MTDDAYFHDEVNVDGVLFEPIKGELYAVVNRGDENAKEAISEHIFWVLFCMPKKYPPAA